MPRYTREQKATAVAEVKAGKTPNAVADEIGASWTTVDKWVKAAKAGKTEDEKKLAERSEEIGERIRKQLDVALDLALARVIKLTPRASMRDVVGAVKIMSEQRALAAGKPTSIHASGLALPDGADVVTLEHAADELHRRRQEVAT